MLSIQFVTTPHLPTGRVTSCAVSSQYPHIIAALEQEGIEVIPVEANKNLPLPVASHVDMNLFHFGKEHVLVAHGQRELKDRLSAAGCQVEESIAQLGCIYPSDIALNVVSLNQCLIGKLDFAAPEIMEYAKQNTLNQIQVKQGYAKCSTAVLSSRAIITSDTSIAHAAKGIGLQALLVQPGQIVLEGYDTGFIGGSCFKINEFTLVFTGDISRHTDYKEIRQFAKEQGITIETLCNAELLDIGSVIPLKQKDS